MPNKSSQSLMLLKKALSKRGVSVTVRQLRAAGHGSRVQAKQRLEKDLKRHANARNNKS